MRKPNKTLATLLLSGAMLMSMSASAFAATVNSTPSAPLSAASADVTVSATVDPTVTLAVSTNAIDFGHINPLTPTYDQNMTVTVQSNSTYNLTVVGAGDFAGANNASDTMSIDHLGVKLDADNSYQPMSASTPVSLASNQPNTASQVYNVDLQMNSDWQIVPDVYSTTITYQAQQI